MGLTIRETDWPDFRALMRAWKSGELTRRQAREQKRSRVMHSRLVTLLADLDPEGATWAEVMKRSPADRVLDVGVTGKPDSSDPGIVRLTFGEEIVEWPAIATAAEAGKALQDALRTQLVSVTLGTHVVADVDYPIMRWRIVLRGDAAMELPETDTSSLNGIASLLVQWVPYVGTGRLIRVYSVIPTGTPGPVRAGAQCGCRHFSGTGWGITEAECRKFTPAEAVDPYEV